MKDSFDHLMSMKIEVLIRLTIIRQISQIDKKIPLSHHNLKLHSHFLVINFLKNDGSQRIVLPLQQRILLIES